MSTDNDARDTREDAQFYWRCNGCGCDYTSPYGDHKDEFKHSKEEHGSFDAVSWEAVAPSEVDNE